MTSRKLLTLPDRQAAMRERQSEGGAVVSNADFAQRHYSVKEIANLWGLGPDTVRRLFQNEPGVLVLGSGADCRRRYTTLRIPQQVAERVYKRSLRR